MRRGNGQLSIVGLCGANRIKNPVYSDSKARIAGIAAMNRITGGMV